MQIEATYDDGRLEFHQPLQFASRRFSVFVIVPDDEIAGKVDPSASASLTAGKDDPLCDAARQWLHRFTAIWAAFLPAAARPTDASGDQASSLWAFSMREGC
ncbi:MAG: hypothetical protein WBG92_08430 [Thiohalocapsa sp.]